MGVTVYRLQKDILLLTDCTMYELGGGEAAGRQEERDATIFFSRATAITLMWIFDDFRHIAWLIIVSAVMFG